LLTTLVAYAVSYLPKQTELNDIKYRLPKIRAESSALEQTIKRDYKEDYENPLGENKAIKLVESQIAENKLQLADVDTRSATAQTDINGIKEKIEKANQELGDASKQYQAQKTEYDADAKKSDDLTAKLKSLDDQILAIKEDAEASAKEYNQRILGIMNEFYENKKKLTEEYAPQIDDEKGKISLCEEGIVRKAYENRELGLNDVGWCKYSRKDFNKKVSNAKDYLKKRGLEIEDADFIKYWVSFSAEDGTRVFEVLDRIYGKEDAFSANFAELRPVYSDSVVYNKTQVYKQLNRNINLFNDDKVAKNKSPDEKTESAIRSSDYSWNEALNEYRMLVNKIIDKDDARYRAMTSLLRDAAKVGAMANIRDMYIDNDPGIDSKVNDVIKKFNEQDQDEFNVACCLSDYKTEAKKKVESGELKQDALRSIINKTVLALPRTLERVARLQNPVDIVKEGISPIEGACEIVNQASKIPEFAIDTPFALTAGLLRKDVSKDILGIRYLNKEIWESTFFREGDNKDGSWFAKVLGLRPRDALDNLDSNFRGHGGIIPDFLIGTLKTIVSPLSITYGNKKLKEELKKEKKEKIPPKPVENPSGIGGGETGGDEFNGLINDAGPAIKQNMAPETSQLFAEAAEIKAEAERKARYWAEKKARQQERLANKGKSSAIAQLNHNQNYLIFNDWRTQRSVA
jgi:hypothetical protein